jgi:hypothetical protein
MNNVADIIINEDLSLEELSEVVKEALAKMYSKLETEIGMHYPIGVIKSLGRDSYDVDIRIIDGTCGTGEWYAQTYCL